MFHKYRIRNLGSNHQRCSIKKGALRNFTKFTGKQLYESAFLNEVAGLSPTTLLKVLKKTLWHRFRYFVKFLITPFLQNTSGRLLLESQGVLVKMVFGTVS